MELTVFMATLFYRYEFKLQDPSMDELPTVEGVRFSLQRIVTCSIVVTVPAQTDRELYCNPPQKALIQILPWYS